MMYILTEEEMTTLKKAKDLEFRISEKKLQTLCTKICNEMPVQWGWGSDKNDPEYLKPWGCKLTHEHEWYCDECPVQEICPASKSWSQ